MNRWCRASRLWMQTQAFTPCLFRSRQVRLADASASSWAGGGDGALPDRTAEADASSIGCRVEVRCKGQAELTIDFEATTQLPAGGQISGVTRFVARILLHVLVRDAVHTDEAPQCHSLDRQPARQDRSRPGATTGDCRGACRPPVCAGPPSSRTSACARRATSTAPSQRVRAGLVRLDRQGQRDIICSALRRIEIDGDRIEVATPHEPLVPRIWAARYRRAHLGSGRSTGGGRSQARTCLSRIP